MLRDVLIKMVAFSEGGEFGVRHDSAGRAVCYYCGVALDNVEAHADHLAPKARGGKNGAYNMVLTCAQCNVRKNARHPLDWLVEQELPPEIEVDVLARLLVGVWAAWQRRKDEADVSVAAVCGEYAGAIVLPGGWRLGDVLAQQPCPICQGHGATIEMPVGLWGLLRCGMCGFSEIVKMTERSQAE